MKMATQTQYAGPSIESAFERVTEAGEQFVAATRLAGNLYLDSYEKAVDRAIELELKVAGATQQAWVNDLVQAQTDFARELSSSYTSAARILLK
jgi:hypothetical protein